VANPKGKAKHDLGSGYAGTKSKNNWIRSISV
jgi:hypothetical protein